MGSVELGKLATEMNQSKTHLSRTMNFL